MQRSKVAELQSYRVTELQSFKDDGMKSGMKKNKANNCIERIYRSREL